MREVKIHTEGLTNSEPVSRMKLCKRVKSLFERKREDAIAVSDNEDDKYGKECSRLVGRVLRENGGLVPEPRLVQCAAGSVQQADMWGSIPVEFTS